MSEIEQLWLLTFYADEKNGDIFVLQQTKLSTFQLRFLEVQQFWKQKLKLEKFSNFKYFLLCGLFKGFPQNWFVLKNFME